MLRQSSFIASLLVAAVIGCGGLQNPNDALATVSGSLGSGSGSTSATVPSNAHVALVWLGTSTTNNSSSVNLIVSNDVPIVDGSFTMALTNAPPSNAAFNTPSDFGYSDSSAVAETPAGSGSTGSNASAGTSQLGTSNIRPLDNTSGTIVQDLTVAVAGFIVYVDTSGDGALTLDSSGNTTDTIVAGSSDLVLAYFQNGTDVELQNLADKDKQVPTRGYNLASVSAGRYEPLNDVQLTTTGAHLPSPVCDSSDGSSGFSDSPSSGTDVATTTEIDDGGVSGFDDASAATGYPSPNDPNLQCSADGTSFYYSEPSSGCDSFDAGAPQPPGTTSVCTNGAATITAVDCGGPSGYEESLPSGPVPSGWPCTVTAQSAGKDAGSAPDAG